MLEAAVFGAYFNVMINLKDITDEKFKFVVSRAARAPPGGAAEGAEVAVTPRGPSWPSARGGTRGVLGGWLFWPVEWQMTHLVPTQMSQKVTGLLEEAKQGSAVVLALLDKRVA